LKIPHFEIPQTQILGSAIFFVINTSHFGSVSYVGQKAVAPAQLGLIELLIVPTQLDLIENRLRRHNWILYRIGCASATGS
jgi:hypothetical protein